MSNFHGKSLNGIVIPNTFCTNSFSNCWWVSILFALNHFATLVYICLLGTSFSHYMLCTNTSFTISRPLPQPGSYSNVQSSIWMVELVEMYTAFFVSYEKQIIFMILHTLMIDGLHMCHTNEVWEQCRCYIRITNFCIKKSSRRNH